MISQKSSLPEKDLQQKSHACFRFSTSLNRVLCCLSGDLSHLITEINCYSGSQSPCFLLMSVTLHKQDAWKYLSLFDIDS